MESAKRISWEHYFSSIAELASLRSSCDRLHVGCILVKDNRIVSTGYNGHIPGSTHGSFVRDGHEQMTVHAEENAILDCAKRGVSCNDCEAYITHYPCLKCFKMLATAGITKIYYIKDYKNDELINVINKDIGLKIIQLKDLNYIHNVSTR